MIECIKDTIEVTEVKETKTEEICRCDICKKIIYKKDLINNKANQLYIPYWHISTSHSDWGRDSIDSIEYFDVCSDDCLATKMYEYISESSSNRPNSMEMNIEHCDTQAKESEVQK